MRVQPEVALRKGVITMSYEKPIITGNLGADPTLTFTKDGTAVTNLSVAVNKKRKDGQRTTTWCEVSVFEKQAEVVCEYLKKGSKVLAECSSLRVSLYIAKDGKPAASLNATAERVVFLDSAQDHTNGVSQANNGQAAEEVSDIPF